jgi:hypothetical protein
LLHNIPSVENLICDIILEAYILDTRPYRHFLPNLKTINRIPVELKDLGKRTQEKQILEIMRKMWRRVGTYRLVKPGVMDEDPTFYIDDEVGASICHSDTPNTKLAPLIYSPNCQVDDPQTMTYTVLWPVKDIPKDELLYRDYLNGVSEKQWRSARLLPWFNVFEEYYQEEFEKFKAI